MAKTVNNWPVLFDARTTGSLPRLRRWKVPGVDRYFLLRDGAIGFVLMHFILWFHEKVERLDVNRTWDEWGWAVRPVRGQTTGYSNHAGGAAADVNSVLHPIGVSIWRTFKRWQIRLIRLTLAKPRYKVLAWGGDWSRPDGMHIEVRKVALRKVEKKARRLMKTKRGQRILKANPGAKKVILS